MRKSSSESSEEYKLPEADVIKSGLLNVIGQFDLIG